VTVSFYAAILGLLICWLALRVISVRRKHKVLYIDGGVTELQIARTAHSNAIEYIPISLILLFTLEFNGAPLWLIHIVGVCFVVGRCLHCRAILTENLKLRVLGMQLTLFSIIGLSIFNMIYLPYSKLLF